MMRRWFVIGLIGLMGLMGCSEELTPEQQAANAAKEYYTRLLEGYPDGLLAAKVGSDEHPGDYSQQLKKAYKQYVVDIQRKHGGLQSVAISDNPSRLDTVQNIVYTFLILSFKDSTQEEITVPMVCREGEWLIK